MKFNYNWFILLTRKFASVVKVSYKRVLLLKSTAIFLACRSRHLLGRIILQIFCTAASPPR
jgi:hypothetical protein